ncbi:GNAT family N-acetyltransferase [Streptococcus sanguinis]|uniref:GNAT family N-acetyltransferase n=1 Tax=Streptococcus sanguinis TaxID=1305 RepID=UPI001CBE7DA5|nr:GNAT family N-acetyltransferase [Streptococcus sanguinis]MBZ2022676.1 GNAT family N-acetyltransferase [Streptococcus sanguinis]MBZ2047374.1 GNAT family N-acetyltransferase [Streptococcus sanguinis]MBZ2049932.1 GNAT family N-acetyltransferase [Streptococcus sanguinis]MBZ2058943.1 GNAT family N-acetyltransferase [Streptococcus sanguinis]MCC3178143.1 acetyltransferase family protein [Streptococcus sanguinis]
MTEIRPLKQEEIPLLEEFLYQAIFIPSGLEPLPRSILKEPDLDIYIKDFGQQPDDWALAAEVDGRLVGAVWVRIMKDYGYYDDQTPSLSISFLPEFRGQGLGQQLMTAMLDLLKAKGYSSVSLSVSKDNPAVRFYQRLGIVTVEEREDDYLMLCRL